MQTTHFGLHKPIQQNLIQFNENVHFLRVKNYLKFAKPIVHDTKKKSIESESPVILYQSDNYYWIADEMFNVHLSIYLLRSFATVSTSRSLTSTIREGKKNKTARPYKKRENRSAFDNWPNISNVHLKIETSKWILMEILI